jgi:hypothetical protein
LQYVKRLNSTTKVKFFQTNPVITYVEIREKEADRMCFELC